MAPGVTGGCGDPMNRGQRGLGQGRAGYRATRVLQMLGLKSPLKPRIRRGEEGTWASGRAGSRATGTWDPESLLMATVWKGKMSRKPGLGPGRRGVLMQGSGLDR